VFLTGYRYRVIKVIPGRDYLKELRNILYGKTDKQHYSNDDTLELFKSNFALLEVERVRYNVTLEQTWLESLIQMTPLTWGTTQARLLEARKGELPVMTIDLTILAGEKHY
jgi:23S rRNA (guanine745-N1)-methyltransferase